LFTEHQCIIENQHVIVDVTIHAKITLAGITSIHDKMWYKSGKWHCSD